MEQIVTTIQGLSGNEADLAQLMTFLKEQASQVNNADGILQAIHTLNLSQHSYGVLWLLDAFLKAAGQAVDMTFIDLVSAFLMACNPAQIRLAPDMFVKLGRKFRELVMTNHCSRKGILPLKSAIIALQPSTEHLTPLHSDFLMLCLDSKCYNAASELLAQDIFYVEPAKTTCTPRDLFLYCRYGSMVCIGRKQWQRATELHMCAITAPAMAGNAIVLDCYKQFVLVSLLMSGTAPALPKVVSASVRSVIEVEARPYTELANAYISYNYSKLMKVCEQHQAVYAADGNLGLVGQVLKSFVPRTIQRLTSTYLTLSLADIAQQVGLPSAEVAEKMILQLVSSGHLFAVISDVDGGMVRFLETPERFSSEAAAARLASAVEACMEVTDRVAGMQHTLATSREYIRKVVSKDRNKVDAAHHQDAVVAPAVESLT